VVRIGETVRKRWAASTPHVVAYLDGLRTHGIDVPQVLGRDAAGRQILEFVSGTRAIDREPLTLDDLFRVGTMVRAIHDASEHICASPSAVWQTAIPAPGDDLICHNDLAPWNLIMGERWVFIDWDAAAPSTRLWDLAYAAQAFTLSDADADPPEAATSLAAFVDGYRPDASIRSGLPDAIARRTHAMYDTFRTAHLNDEEPWSTMFVSGHGAHWESICRFVDAHARVWSRALA
jgi:tRNA A-37 threonylcarbamoyl transferase component Bud32